ncbi:hypothetical protein BD324DRAFT_623845 [Kockovaella imperatae]|uniref:rRNA-processing protein n=1 Tax=Kockovaella imperatae TaxID=4999 RepID=A0A1Y1UK94_9TREE|nr:hypothetical protein BD324DRAFT_623845 [Kockovaella imperatae]ORX37924.1 hypothetical protein BD324DRAFT_623845 [Kockovaella imperatae]
MEVDNPSAGPSAPVRSLAASKNGRTAGKAHKESKSAARRSYLSRASKQGFEHRKELESKRQAMKGVEKEMKEEKEAEQERKRTAIKERRERQEEKQRLELVKAKMSAKKLQRMKKRQGRTKKING